MEPVRHFKELKYSCNKGLGQGGAQEPNGHLNSKAVSMQLVPEASLISNSFLQFKPKISSSQQNTSSSVANDV